MDACTHTPDTFECPHCLGQGRVDISGNNPQPYYGECDECRGSGELSAEQMLDYAMDRISSCRNMAHMFNKNRAVYFRYWEQARYWIGFAKKARTIVLEREHAGAGHIGQEAA
jgi:hypothetical protein